jgi:hypothetical protein
MPSFPVASQSRTEHATEKRLWDSWPVICGRRYNCVRSGNCTKLNRLENKVKRVVPGSGRGLAAPILTSTLRWDEARLPIPESEQSAGWHWVGHRSSQVPGTLQDRLRIASKEWTADSESTG